MSAPSISSHGSRRGAESDPSGSQSPAGLCGDCTHARRIESARGSVFILCQLSSTDPRFPKYPRLPVLSCPGYLQARKTEPSSTVLATGLLRGGHLVTSPPTPWPCVLLFSGGTPTAKPCISTVAPAARWKSPTSRAHRVVEESRAAKNQETEEKANPGHRTSEAARWDENGEGKCLGEAER
jgi:hypothetical protein